MDIRIDALIGGLETFTTVAGAENAPFLDPNKDSIWLARIECDRANVGDVRGRWKAPSFAAGQLEEGAALMKAAALVIASEDPRMRGAHKHLATNVRRGGKRPDLFIARISWGNVMPG